jgi:hypothetical protein
MPLVIFWFRTLTEVTLIAFRCEIPAMIYTSPYLNHCSVELSAEKLKKNPSINSKNSSKNGESGHIAAQTFPFRELATATRNFRAECLLGEGGFGRVYKGHLETINQVNMIHHFFPIQISDARIISYEFRQHVTELFKRVHFELTKDLIFFNFECRPLQLSNLIETGYKGIENSLLKC